MDIKFKLPEIKLAKSDGHIVNISPFEITNDNSFGTKKTTIVKISIVITLTLSKKARASVSYINDRGVIIKTKEVAITDEVYDSWGEDDSVIETFILNTLELTKVE